MLRKIGIARLGFLLNSVCNKNSRTALTLAVAWLTCVLLTGVALGQATTSVRGTVRWVSG